MIVSKEQLKELMSYSDSLARKFFFTYRNTYLADSKDLGDLKGECEESITLIVNDPKYADVPFDELKKIVGEWMRLKLMKVKVYAERRNPRINNTLSDEFDLNELKGKDSIDLETVSINREDLCKLIDKEMVEIIISKHYDKKTFEEIADELGYTKQWIHYLYTKAKNLLIKKLKIQHFQEK